MTLELAHFIHANSPSEVTGMTCLGKGEENLAQKLDYTIMLVYHEVPCMSVITLHVTEG